MCKCDKNGELTCIQIDRKYSQHETGYIQFPNVIHKEQAQQTNLRNAHPIDSVAYY